MVRAWLRLAVVGVGLLASVGLSAQRSEPSEPSVVDRRPAEGEQCLVCRQAIDYGEIVEIRYKGRSFHVSEAMLEDFRADPELYFEALEAHSALFDEGAMETSSMRMGWLNFGFYVLIGLVFGAACSYIALDRGLPAVGWFFAGLAVNVLALAVLLTRPRGEPGLAGAPGLAKIPSTHTPQSCLDCGNTNHPSARVCSGCGKALDPAFDAETQRV